MKKVLFVIFGFVAAGLFLGTDAKAQPATSDLYCEEAPAGTPVCNVAGTQWAERRKQLHVDEVCCVWKSGDRGKSNPEGVVAEATKKGAKVAAVSQEEAKEEPQAGVSSHEVKLPIQANVVKAPAKVGKPSPKSSPKVEKASPKAAPSSHVKSSPKPSPKSDVKPSPRPTHKSDAKPAPSAKAPASKSASARAAK